MKDKFHIKEICLIIITYLISRIVSSYFNIEFQFNSIYSYWQYLHIETLKNNLLPGVWYNHTQPPLFNLILGTILKIFGNESQLAFSFLFKTISLLNAILLYLIVNKIVAQKTVSILISLFYILSPAAIVYETEIFYTTTITLLFLIFFYFLLKLKEKIIIINIIGVFAPILFACLTRSMYHIVFFIVISTIIIAYFRKSVHIRKIIITASIFIILISSWYLKNYYFFSTFSSSSWIGMNLSRNVFHDIQIKDSSKITSLEPFQKISAYNKFIKNSSVNKFRNLNDRDLICEFKNDSFINLNHIDYIEVSKLYLAESKNQIVKHPIDYIKNTLTSSILFFAPGTTYSLLKEQTNKLKYYDIIYSFNLTHFAKNKLQRRIALLISALPKFILYLSVFLWLFRITLKKKNISLINLLCTLIICYVFILSSLLEHYENMRFRFEVEPIFLILVSQFFIAQKWIKKKLGLNK